MAGLFDIGSSGIAAYRKALNVTGQNIANLNTDGYRRRDVSLTEISGSQGGITAISDQTGLGVRAEDVTRAFDSYVAQRARDSQADFYEIEAFNTSLTALEDVVVPQDYDLTFYLNTFFSALGGIGQAPGDLAPRISALEQAGTLATGFSETANNLENLRQAILAQAEQVTSELNTNIKAMQTMQSQLLSSGQGGSAPNAMLDERDRLVLAISDLAGLSVEYGSRGDVTLTLGETLGGPKLIDGLKAGQIGLDVGDGRINVMSGKAGSATLTQQLSSGRLSGLLAAYEAVSLTIDSLDVMAQKVVTDLNSVHSSGLTLDGQRGQAMFSLSAASVSADGNNLGQIATSVDDTKLDGESNINLQLIFDAKANLWRGYDSAGNEQVSGTKSIAIGGLSVVIDGKPADGDILMLRTSQGAAANMKFLLTRPEDFAAAGLTLASADSKNSGTGDLTATMGAPLVASTLRPIDTVLTNSASAMSATRLLKEGAITSIPATATSVELFSLARQDSVSYTLSPAEMSRATALNIELSGGVKTFNFDFAAIKLENPTADFADLADLLNSGSILVSTASLGTPAPRTLKDFGLFASGSGGNLTLASAVPSGSNVAYSLVSGAGNKIVSNGVNINAVYMQGNDTASQIQIFTREGRQIAGTPLSQTDVVDFLTVENGFVEGAEYRADYLNAVNGQGYLGIDVQRSSSSGDFQRLMNGAGFLPTVIGAQSGDPDTAGLSSTVQSSMSLQIGSSSSQTIEIPQGVQAGYIAKLINAESADMGVSATAFSRISLSDIPDGIVSFSLVGGDGGAQAITAAVRDGSMETLRDAVNSRANQTGITAALSSDGKRLLLDQKDGDDIVLNKVRSAGVGFTAQIVDQEGVSWGTGTTTTLGSGNAAARFMGNVALQSAASFSVVGLAGSTSGASANAFLNGLISRDVDMTGSTQVLNFDVVEGIDSNESDPMGVAASAAAANYSLTLGGTTGLTAAVSSSELKSVSPSGLAAALANELRAQAPTASINGQAVATLPAQGASISLSLGGQVYKISVVQKYDTYRTDGTIANQDVELLVSGPEAGRISASFDKYNVLHITTNGGVETGQNLVLTATTPQEAAAFGLAASLTSSIMGQTFDPDAVNVPNIYNSAGDKVFAKNVEFILGETKYTATVSGTQSASVWTYADVSFASNGSTVTPAALASLGVTMRVDYPFGVNGVRMNASSPSLPQIIIEQTQAITLNASSNKAIRIVQSVEAAGLGLKTVGSQILLAGQGMTLSSVDGKAVLSDASASSLAGEHVTLTNLPGEELIVIMNGANGARRLTANYDISPNSVPLPPRSLEVRMMDENTGTVEVFDVLSGDSIATRLLGSGTQFTAAGYQFVLKGSSQTGDAFFVTTADASAGDGRNLDSLMQLQNRDIVSGKGGFHDIFRSMITQVGSKLRASEIAQASASSLRDAAAEVDAQFSGVDLDTEAARLLEQQQAYQALARVLSTAKELLNTLLDSI